MCQLYQYFKFLTSSAIELIQSSDVAFLPDLKGEVLD